jgi:hypothetical protein
LLSSLIPDSFDRTLDILRIKFTFFAELFTICFYLLLSPLFCDRFVEYTEIKFFTNLFFFSFYNIMTTLTGLIEGNFTDIDVVDTIRVNGDSGSNNQVLTSDGTFTSYKDPTAPPVADILTAGTGISITSTGNPETISTNVKSLILDGTAVSGAPVTFNPNADGGDQTITINDTDTQLNLTAGAGINVTTIGGSLNKLISAKIDTDTLVFDAGDSVTMEVAKVPNTLTAGTNISFDVGTTYDGSGAVTISSQDTDTQLNLTEGNGISITDTGGLNRTIAVSADGTTLSNNVGSGQAGVLKVPNLLTAGTNISFVDTSDGASATTYDGSSGITISSTDTNTTYTGGKNITIDTATNPDTINLDAGLTNIDSITFTSGGGSTALTGNDYPSNPTPMTYFDLSSATNVFPTNLGGVGVGGLGGVYKDEANGFLYRFLLPSDFLNDNDSSGYARSVIADSGNHGAQQCYAGSQYYAFFTIPDGYYFSGFRVNLVNSVGTPQGSTPTSSFYVNVYTKTIDSNLSSVGTTKGFNTDNLGYTITSGYSASWDINDPITIGAIHCFRNPWSSSYYNRGGWIQYTATGGGG